MKRAMMQAYVNGSDQAVPLYIEAFGAKLGDAYPAADGTYMHAELEFDGYILAVAEAAEMTGYFEGDTEAGRAVFAQKERVTGNTMQFCLHFGEGGTARVERAFAALAEGATVIVAPGPCGYSPCMTDLIDRFGVRWCLFE